MSDWTNGWYALAAQLPSPNFGPRPEKILVDLVVLHSISLPPGQYGGDQVERLFTNTLDWNEHPYFERIRGIRVSSHFFVRRTGELLQFVSCNSRAWHAGVSNFQGRDNCNDYSIGIELEGLEGCLFEEQQYETLSSLCTAIFQQYPILQIVGHEHIAPGRKTDPGCGFNWARLQHLLGCRAQFFPAGILTQNAS